MTLILFNPAPPSGEGEPPAGRWKGMGGNASRMAAGPLHHASHGPPPPLRFTARVRISNTVLATRSCARALPTTKQIDSPPSTKREAKRRKAHANHVPRSINKRCRLPMPRARLRATQTSVRSLRTRLLAGRARLPALRPRLSQGFPPLLSSRPCFLGLGTRRATAPHASAVVPKGPKPLRRGLRARAEAPHSLHTADRIRNASLDERDAQTCI
jgi:hypothetical protein